MMNQLINQNRKRKMIPKRMQKANDEISTLEQAYYLQIPQPYIHRETAQSTVSPYNGLQSLC